jgi:hypothetical protein
VSASEKLRELTYLKRDSRFDPAGAVFAALPEIVAVVEAAEKRCAVEPTFTTRLDHAEAANALVVALTALSEKLGDVDEGCDVNPITDWQFDK